MDKIELMKIQIIFGNNWIGLSEQEIEKKEGLKKEYEDWQAENEKNPEIGDCSSWYLNALVKCKKLSEALNPDKWESLGAVEIGKRIREFQEI